MGGVITVLVYAFVFFALIARIRKKKGSVSPKVVKTYRKNKSAGVNAHMARERAVIHEWEDRDSDWLARQMADERVAKKRMSEMFQLKLEHRYNCDAEMLKQFHESHCEADEIDTAKA